MEFRQAKEKALSKVDRSKKGSIDAPISMLVDAINSLPVFFTTSSCSGRVAVFWQSEQDCGVGQKKDGQWLYTTHGMAVASELMESVASAPSHGEASLKFEPVVLHIQCASLQFAQDLLAVALQAGLRNSGLVVGRKQRIMLAVRSTHGLEVPLVANGKLLVGKEYIDHLVCIANAKMDENIKRIGRLTEGVHDLCQRLAQLPSECSQAAESTSKTSRRKRKTQVSGKPQRDGGASTVLGDSSHTLQNSESLADGVSSGAGYHGQGHYGDNKDLLAQSNDRDSEDDPLGFAMFEEK